MTQIFFLLATLIFAAFIVLHEGILTGGVMCYDLSSQSENMTYATKFFLRN